MRHLTQVCTRYKWGMKPLLSFLLDEIPRLEGGGATDLYGVLLKHIELGRVAFPDGEKCKEAFSVNWRRGGALR